MSISKKTVKEVLSAYLSGKGLDKGNIDAIIDEVFNSEECSVKVKKDINKKEEKTKTSHGTSCPRIMTKSGRLVVEF